MIKLNLLSPPAKKNVQQRRLYGVLKNISITIFVLLFVNASLLLGAKYMLVQLTNEINVHTGQITANSEGYNQKVKDINDKLAFTDGIQKDNVGWSCLFDEIFSKSTIQIRFTSLSVNKSDGGLIISGHANTRDALLVFKSNMEKSELIKSIELPLQNLLVKEDIDFSITAKLNEAGLIGAKQ